jgi:hypothetical protein
MDQRIQHPNRGVAAAMTMKRQEPLSFGINAAKRAAKAADKRDRKLILSKLGPGFPKQKGTKHAELLASRRKYYDYGKPAKVA